MCRALSYISMVGRAGASQDAPVSVRPVRLTPSGSTTHEISLSSGGNSLLLTGGCHHGYNPQSRTPVICCPLQRYHGFYRAG
ncbi:ash family protein [Klebsiella huaxiensis]|uniref:ash family protein n=1 Tax=Klebsiella huaxiensis TaxID=2153354 RepID=UPI00163C1A25